MKPDEFRFLEAIINANGKSVRDVINDCSPWLNHKRAWRILEKWARQGIYEYGVSLDLGWLVTNPLWDEIVRRKKPNGEYLSVPEMFSEYNRLKQAESSG